MRSLVVFHLWGTRFLFWAQPSLRLIGPLDSSSENTQSVGKKYQIRLTKMQVDHVNDEFEHWSMIDVKPGLGKGQVSPNRSSSPHSQFSPENDISECH